MALHDGFFDSKYDETTDKYDRGYDVEPFLTYFDQIVGSGVCLYKNENSFMVRLEGGSAVVSPGYLFITGHWLKNDADYTVPLTATGIQAVVAHLNTSDKRIDIEARSVAQSYPDSLVLAIVDPASSSVEDTRYNGDICGVIDAAGSVSAKVEWALNYIDTEIDAKLAQAEEDINAQSRKLDLKIAEVQAQIDKIEPPPVGSIKFSASQNVGAEWLRCDGGFVNEQDYPELVAALGKLTPSGDKFQLLSDGEISPQITNGVLYGGRMWVYSYSAKKLYGVDAEGSEPIKEITVSSENSGFKYFMPSSNAFPLALSIVPSLSGGKDKIFLSQILKDGDIGTTSTEENFEVGKWGQYFLIYESEFSGAEDSLNMSASFSQLHLSSYEHLYIKGIGAIPYIVSSIIDGVETYLCITFGVKDSVYQGMGIQWKLGESIANVRRVVSSTPGNKVTTQGTEPQRIAFSRKNQGEAIVVYTYIADSQDHIGIKSIPSGIFDREVSTGNINSIKLTIPHSINIGGGNKVLFGYSPAEIPTISTVELEGWKANTLNLSLPSSARMFIDGSAYLWGKDIYLIFVGTGIIFSRTLEDGSFGYLDTTSVLGTITQFGYLDYSQDEGTLYLLGQDTANRVKVAKIVLNTLYDYANDGAWLPLIASDGVPAYIKAYDTSPEEKVSISITVLPAENSFDLYGDVIFNGESFAAGTYTRTLSSGSTFTVGIKKKADFNSGNIRCKFNGTVISTIYYNQPNGTTATGIFNVSDNLSGITLQGVN